MENSQKLGENLISILLGIEKDLKQEQGAMTKELSENKKGCLEIENRTAKIKKKINRRVRKQGQGNLSERKTNRERKNEVDSVDKYRSKICLKIRKKRKRG